MVVEIFFKPYLKKKCIYYLVIFVIFPLATYQSYNDFLLLLKNSGHF